MELSSRRLDEETRRCIKVAKLVEVLRRNAPAEIDSLWRLADAVACLESSGWELAAGIAHVNPPSERTIAMVVATLRALEGAVRP